MTLQAVGHALHFPGICNSVHLNPAIGTLATLDAAGEYQAFVFQAKEDMVISHVGWRTGTVAGAPTADTRIETVATDGTPSGTLWNTNTNIVSGALVSNTWTLHALTASATISKGQIFCVKVVYASGTSLIIQWNSVQNRFRANFPYRVTNTTGSAVKAIMDGTAVLALGSSSSAFYAVENALPITSSTTSAFNNTNSAARGVRFQVPFRCRCVGIAWYANQAVGDFKPLLTDDAGASLIGTNSTIDGDQNAVATNAMAVYFDTPVTLSPGVWYRAAIEPQGATNTSLSHFSIPSNSYVGGLWAKGFWQRGARVSGTWTDTDTDFPVMDIIIDQLEDGGGMIVHPGMNGRLAA